MEATSLSSVTAKMQQLAIVDTLPLLAKCVSILSSEEIIFVAAKSPLLGRGGSISILQLAIRGSASRPDSIFLIDLTTLGAAAFGKLAGASLGEILASRVILKVAFDCRNLADALFHVYGVHLEHTLDMQCMHMILMPKARYLISFFKVLRDHSVMDTALATYEDYADLRTFYLQESGPQDYETRPLPDNVTAMCLMDILFYEPLYISLRWDLQKNQLHQASALSEERLQVRLDESYEPQGPSHKINDLFRRRPWPRHHRPSD